MKIVMKTEKKYYKKHEEEKINMHAITIVAVIILGVLFGCYFAMKFDVINESDFKTFLSQIGINNNQNNVLGVETFIKNVIQNIKLIIIVWLLGFNRYLLFGTVMINIYKGFIEGFTTYYLISRFGLDALKLALIPLFSYKLFYIYLLAYISIHSLKFTFSQEKAITITNEEFRKYIMNLIVGILGVGVVSLIETMLVPIILG